VRADQSALSAPKLSFDTNEFFLRSSSEMVEAFTDLPEALPTTLEIAERCNVRLKLGERLIPSFDTPDGRPEADYPARARRAGPAAALRRPAAGRGARAHGVRAVVIDQMGFNAYFLIVWDFVKFAKENGITVAPGAARRPARFVAYCLAITDVDPLRYELLFERFLNPERVSMPDIDIDFSVRGRERVIRYVTERYGADRVAQIITFGQMKPRAATRDAARVLGHDYGTGDRLAKLIPEPIMGRPPSFDDCLGSASPSAPSTTKSRRPSRSSMSRAASRHRAELLHPRAAVVIADRR